MRREKPRSTEWDPILLISQIAALQALHYLTLSLILPPFLMFFSDRASLYYEGGPWNVGMVMDWREMAGKPTVHGLHGSQHRGWIPFEHKNKGEHAMDNIVRISGVDPMRGWIISALWIVTSLIDVYYIYAIIRKPKLVLDFSLTLLFNHIVLTTYYSASLPTSLFFWAVVIAGAAIKIVLGEQMCVKRELREGIAIPQAAEERALHNDMEMGNLRPD